MKRHTITIIVAVALLAASCGASDDGGDTGSSTSPSTSAPSTTTSSTSTPPTIVGGEPDRLVLQVNDEGGFVPVEFLLTRIPRYSLYADGTLLAPGPIPEIFPGPVLQPVESIVLGDDDLRDILVLIDAIGLPDIGREIDDRLTNTVADATTTVATYFDDDGEAHSYGVYALGLDMDAPMPDASANLGLLLELLDAFVAGGPAALYQPDRIQVWLQEGTIFDPEFVETGAWPLEIVPDDFELEATFNRPCHVLAGDAAAAAVAAFDEANQATAWDFDGTVYSLIARPLLPGEPGCIP